MLAAKYLNNYVFTVIGSVGAANSDVKQEVVCVERTGKREKLLDVLKDIDAESSKYWSPRNHAWTYSCLGIMTK